MIDHTEKAMQGDVNWPRTQTRLEAELGGYPPPPPPPPPPAPEVDFRQRVISPAYRDYLGRRRNADGTYGDAKGLADKNTRMNHEWIDSNDVVHPPMTKAEMEEEIIRSDEFRDKN
jgi:hypothetical protein